MSSDTRLTALIRSVALATLLLTCACGFTPALGTQGTASILRDQIVVVAPETIAGFQMRVAITDRLGLVQDGDYRLEIAMAEDQTPAAITEDGETTRFDLSGQADWVLSRNGGLRIDAGTVESFTSYSATGSTVATQGAAADARKRLTGALADLILADLFLVAVP